MSMFDIHINGDYSGGGSTLRADLASHDAGKGAELVARLKADSMFSLVSLPVPTTDGFGVELRAFYSGTDAGGGRFYWDANRNKSSANGGTIIDPTTPGTLSATSLGTFLNVQGTGSGTGCWIRQYNGNVAVTWFGAVADEVANDQAAIQAAVTFVESLGSGTVFFPAGNYRVNSLLRTTPTSNLHLYDGNPIVISSSNIRLLGEGGGLSRLAFYDISGGGFEANWQTVDNEVWRGAGIFIKGGATEETKITNVEITWLDLDGGTNKTGNQTFPADPITGDGWDITHRGIWLEADRYFGHVRITDCHIKNFKGEIVYNGGNRSEYIVVRGCEIHETNGDCISFSAGGLIYGNRLYDAAHASIENTQQHLDQEILANTIYNCDSHGISLARGVNATNPGVLLVHDNIIRNCAMNGIMAQGTCNLTIRNNTAIDCGHLVNNRSFNVTININKSLDVVNVVVENNVALCATRNLNHGFACNDSSSSRVRNVVFRNNIVARSPSAIGNYNFTKGFYFSLGNNAAFEREDFIDYGNTSDSTSAFTTDSEAHNFLLNSTSGLEVAKLRPVRGKNYQVSCYVEVVTAPTNVDIVVEYYNASGIKVTKTIQASASLDVGTYTYTPLFFPAYGSLESNAIKVIATAGTIGQVYVSALINPVRPA